MSAMKEHFEERDELPRRQRESQPWLTVPNKTTLRSGDVSQGCSTAGSRDPPPQPITRPKYVVVIFGPVVSGGSPSRTCALFGSHLGHALLGHWAGTFAPAVLLARSP
jgi:hypothetical protein